MKILHYIILGLFIHPFTSKFTSFHYFINHIDGQKMTKKELKEKIQESEVLSKFFKI